MCHVPCDDVMVHGNASRHMWMRCGSWNVSGVNVSCFVWKRHGAFECVMSHVNALQLLKHVTCEYVMFRVMTSWCTGMRHVTCECVVAFDTCDVWTCHVPCESVMVHENASCYMWMRCSPWNMSRVNMSRPLFNMSWCTWMCHVTCECVAALDICDECISNI